MSSAGLVLPANTMFRARTLYNIGGGLSISPSPTPSACDRSSDCDTTPKPYGRTWYQPICEGLENAPIRDLFPTQLMHLVIIGVTKEAQ